MHRKTTLHVFTIMVLQSKVLRKQFKTGTLLEIKLACTMLKVGLKSLNLKCFIKYRGNKTGYTLVFRDPAQTL